MRKNDSYKLRHDSLTKVLYSTSVYEELIKYIIGDYQLGNGYDEPIISFIHKQIVKNYNEIYNRNMEENEVVNFIYDITNGFEENLHFIELQNAISTNYLTIKNNKVRIKYEKYIDWQGQLYKTKADNIIGVFCGFESEDICKDWILNPKHTNTKLNNLLNCGLSENHMHLNASGNNDELMLNYISNCKISKILSIHELPEGLTKIDMLLINLIKFYFKDKYMLSNSNDVNCCSDSMNLNSNTIINEYLNIIKDVIANENIEELAIYNEYFECIDLMRVDHSLVTSYYDDVCEVINEICDFKVKKDCIASNIENFREDIFVELFKTNSFKKTVTEEYEFIKNTTKFIKNCDSIDKVDDALLFMYMSLTTKFKNAFTQTSTENSFSLFKKYEENKKMYIYDEMTSSYHELVALIYKFENGVDFLEFRLGPLEEPLMDKYYNLYRISKLINLKLKPVIHVIKFESPYEKLVKSEATHLTPGYFFKGHRNYKTRFEFEQQIGKIIYDLKNKSYLPNVIGIDAANYEKDCRPEVFGTFYRRLKFDINKKEKFNDIEYTYHVGEVFNTLTSGLRAIDDTINFLHLSNNDRLGHAVSLGIDPFKYYAKKNHQIYTTYGEHLSDIVWLYKYLVKHNYEDSRFMLELLSEINNELNDLTNHIMQFEFSCDNSSNNNINQITIENFYNSMLLRSDDYKLYNYLNFHKLDNSYKDLCSSIDKDIQLNGKYDGYEYAFKDKVAKKLNQLYIYDKNYKSYYEKSKHVRYSQLYAKAVEFVQDNMIAEVDKKGISVEVNFVSNYLITEIKDYIDHPLFRFCSFKDYNNNTRIKVSINTDDSSVFKTSIYNEYSLIAAVIENDSVDLINQTQIENYIKHLKNLSKQAWGKTPEHNK